MFYRIELANSFERNINIQTACGNDGTRNNTCPTDRGICTINPLANNLWSSKGYCVCKVGYFGENCQFGPLCNSTSPCSGNGYCSVHQDTLTGDMVEKCVCESGYFGRNCSLNPCSNVTCQNGGNCSSVIIPGGSFSYFCKCPITHFGKNCQYEIDRFGRENRLEGSDSSSNNTTALSTPKKTSK